MSQIMSKSKSSYIDESIHQNIRPNSVTQLGYQIQFKHTDFILKTNSK